MTTNLGTIDRVLCAALGTIVLYLAFASAMQLFASLLFKNGAAVVGFIMLGTSTLKMWPMYSALGLKTCKVR